MSGSRRRSSSPPWSCRATARRSGTRTALRSGSRRFPKSFGCCTPQQNGNEKKENGQPGHLSNGRNCLDARDDPVLLQRLTVLAKDELRGRRNEGRKSGDRKVFVVERVIVGEDLLGLRTERASVPLPCPLPFLQPPCLPSLPDSPPPPRTPFRSRRPSLALPPSLVKLKNAPS